jgi:hypothetical protein
MKALKEKRVTDKMTLYILYQEVDETEFEKIVEQRLQRKHGEYYSQHTKELIG